VLRCFEDDDITHVEGKIDPVADAETVETELMLPTSTASSAASSTCASARRPRTRKP
jgi:ribosome-binding ATPase YchF (GTP1/OBG family)